MVQLRGGSRKNCKKKMGHVNQKIKESERSIYEFLFLKYSCFVLHEVQ